MTADWPTTATYRFAPKTLVRVFTFKVPGLMSQLAHDLELHTSAIRGSVEVTGELAKIEATIDLTTLEVHAPLGGLQKREAEKTMRKKVLKRSDATAVLTGRVALAERPILTGELSLVGSRNRPVELPVVIESVDTDARTFKAALRYELLQSDFGIKPYSAMLGALKLEDRLRIEIDAVLTAA